MTSADPADKNDLPAIHWQCPTAGLQHVLLHALQDAARRYMAAAGKPLCVVSGYRTLRRQAELMAAMTDAQLHGMYGRHGIPSYVARITLARKQADAPLTADKVYDILANRHEGYISAHLAGAAVDIAVDGIDLPRLQSILDDCGFDTLDERSLGIPCLHATCRHAPRTIVTS